VSRFGKPTARTKEAETSNHSLSLPTADRSRLSRGVLRRARLISQIATLSHRVWFYWLPSPRAALSATKQVMTIDHCLHRATRYEALNSRSRCSWSFQSHPSCIGRMCGILDKLEPIAPLERRNQGYPSSAYAGKLVVLASAERA